MPHSLPVGTGNSAYFQGQIRLGLTDRPFRPQETLDKILSQGRRALAGKRSDPLGLRTEAGVPQYNVALVIGSRNMLHGVGASSRVPSLLGFGFVIRGFLIGGFLVVS
jgi:hypothetical protein